MSVEDDVILKRHAKIDVHLYDVKDGDQMLGIVIIKFVNNVFHSIKVPVSFKLDKECLEATELERLHFLWHEVEALRNDEKR